MMMEGTAPGARTIDERAKKKDDKDSEDQATINDLL